MTADIWQLGSAALLVVLAGLFSAADAALGSFSRARAEEMRSEGRGGAARLVKLLDDNRGTFVINRQALQDVYVRRGLKRLQGTRDESGKLIEPALKTEFVNDDAYLPITSFEVNRNTATLNLMLTRRVRLVPAAGGKPLTQVAGITLDDLGTFNNYTLVGDGELTVPYLRVKISNKSLFDKLANEGVLEVEGQPAAKYDKDQEYTLRLDQLPIVPPFEVDTNTFADELYIGVCRIEKTAPAATPKSVSNTINTQLCRKMRM
jgi:hypothetical protein